MVPRLGAGTLCRTARRFHGGDAAFYDAISPRAETAIAYCDKFPLDELPSDVQNLLYLLYSMIMVSFPVEVWSQPRVPDSGAAMLECVIEPAP